MKPNYARLVPLLVGAVLLLGTGAFVVSHRSPAPVAAASDEEKAAPPAEVKTAKVRLAPVETLVSASGTLVSRQGASARIAAPVAGRLKAVLVKEGDRVSSGQLLAVVDNQGAQAAQKSAQAALEAAGADAQSADLGVSVASSDARNAVATALAGLQSARAESESAVQSAQAAIEAARSDARKAGFAANTNDLRNAIKQATLALSAARSDRDNAVSSAQNALAQAQTDAAKTRAGNRPEEIAGARSSLATAQAQQNRAEIEQTRAQRLFDKGLFARRQLDDAQTAFRVAQEATRGAQAALDLLLAGARPEDVRAAELRVSAARVALDGSRKSGNARVAQAQAALSLAQSALRQSAPARGEDVRAAGSRVRAAQDALVAARRSSDAKIAAAQSALDAARGGLVKVEASRADARAKRAAQNGKIADLQAAQVAVAQTQVRSPLAGVVLKRLLGVGENADPATPILEVAQPGALDLVAQLPSFDAAQIQVGQSARVSNGGASTLAARVESVGTVDAQSGLQSVRLSVFGAKNLSAGAFANAQIVVARRPLAVVVPANAILSRSGKSAVLVVRGDKASEVEVQTGAKQNGLVEVKGELKPGERVVTQGGYELEDGAPIKSLD